ncbi:MAG: holo-[acyl-carrier-protein] synthase [Candidatus Eisenbacteria bacterium]|nr:holo-[acyl-carrier-protein] synthase [Candidatus Eisenbacteria bacterium]
MGTIRAVGTDIVDLDHFESVVARSRPGFLRYLFTENEIGYCERYRDKTASYAAVFAAKEAFLKALRTGLAPGLRWKDVEVMHERGGAPTILAHGKCVELLGDGRAHVSLSHSRTSAHAVVVIEDEE